jgi:hypothetical protein
MPQMTIYLDEKTERIMRKLAKRKGLSYSRWVAGLIRDAARNTWPEDFLKLAGAFPDAPLADEIRAH